MTNYENEILELVPGDTPKQKHDNMQFIMSLLSDIAYPRRGTPAEALTIEDIASDIQTRKLVKL